MHNEGYEHCLDIQTIKQDCVQFGSFFFVYRRLIWKTIVSHIVKNENQLDVKLSFHDLSFYQCYAEITSHLDLLT
jgi:hypothetical protein